MKLQTVDSLEIDGQQIFHWHLELSSKCALKCPRCPRTERQGQYKITEMNLEFIKKLFPPERLSYVKKILMSGGQGDPIYCNDFIKIISYLKKMNANIQLSITTNGSYKKKEWWKQAAEILQKNDVIIFSVDGWNQKSNEKYRVGSHFQSIIDGIETLKKYNTRAYIIWSAILFRFNQNKLNDIKDLAENTGADAFNLVQSRLFGSINPNYIDKKLGFDPLEPDKIFIKKGATDRGFYINFSKRPSSHTLKPAIFQLIEKYKDTYKNKYIMPLCRIGERGLYVDAEGILYPCSWVSHPFSERKSLKRNKSIPWKKSLWVEYKEQFDLKKHSLEKIFKSSLWKQWQSSLLDSKRAFVECEKYCNPNESKIKIAKLRSKIFYNKEEFNHVLKTAEIYKQNIKKEVNKM